MYARKKSVKSSANMGKMNVVMAAYLIRVHESRIDLT